MIRLFQSISIVLISLNFKAQYTIPVVFHVIHQNGIENISDAQIIDQINILNRDYNNPDTSVIIDTFKSLVADCDIQFKLAQLDPDGNCTNGITRHYSSLTTTGDHQVKSIVHWPPDEYLNFYVVVNAAGLAGHALMPSQADSFPQWDGIVMGHNYIGSIGTSSVATSVVGSHEVGHYLGLEHVWGGNNVPNFYYLPVSQPSNCGTDDGIGDTPNTIGNQNCIYSQMNCGTLDNVQNFMDYSYCGAMFTHGQKARMHSMLDSTLADRNNLWSPSNLVKTGIDSIENRLCGAQIQASTRTICLGDTIEFSDISKHGIIARNWELFGGTTTSLTDSSIKVVYPSTGIYNIKLIVSNTLFTDTVLLENYISVLPNPAILNGIVEDFEWIDSFPTTNWFTLSDNDTSQFEITTNASYSGSKSLFFDNYNNSGIVELNSSTMDLTAPGSKELAFRHAYAERALSINNKLQIYFSGNCGKTWTLVKTLVTSQLKTKVSSDTTFFIPNGQSEWKTTFVTISPTYQTQSFRVKFVFQGDAKGNNFYLDDINVIPAGTIGIKEDWKEQIKICPNPTDSEMAIIKLPHQATISILNNQGKLMFIGHATKVNEIINVEKFPKGNYILKITHLGNDFVTNFIKI